MEETRTIIIGVAGAKGAGKSHYLGVLIHELANRVSERFHASLSAADDLTRRWYDQNYRHPLYVEGRQIPSTERGRACPLIYQLTLARTRHRISPGRTYTLVFFDTAGEHFEDIREMQRYNRYLAHASGLILLLDPQGGTGPDPLDLAARLAEIIRREHSLSVRRRISMHVAVTLSKLDTLTSQFPAGSPMHRDSPHDGFFNLADFGAVDGIVKPIVQKWFGAGLDNFLRRRFTSSGHLAVSALGHAPRSNGQLTGLPAPCRVEDPLLWLLYKLGIVAGRR